MKLNVLYVRVSSLDQKTDRQRVNEAEYDKIIEDKCSGSIPIFDRQGGQQLKKLIELDLVVTVNFWEIDRCGRDLKDILNFLHYTTEKKISVHFIAQGLSTLDDKKVENPITKMVISLLSIVAEMERKLIKERQREGIEIAKLQGKFHGRKTGTKEDPLKFLAKPRVKKAVALMQKGYKNVEIARITGLHSNTVSKVKKMMNAIV